MIIGTPPAEVASALAATGVRLGLFRDRLMWYPELPSTNDVAALMAAREASEGTVVVADAQTAGRGRRGRSWCSPPGAGLYVSVLLRPVPRAAALLTLAAGVALAEGIARSTGLRTTLKWPNDVYVDGRKLAGILAEAGTSPAGTSYAVLGFGLNVTRASYPPDVGVRATSLEVELGTIVDRGLVLAECLAALAQQYEALHGPDGSTVRQWRDWARPMLNRLVEWDHNATVARGVAEDVDDAGALLVRTASGIERILAGDVRWS